MSKLTAVGDRIDYISNPERQEHCYAFYATAAPEFWERLSEQAQFDFWKSHQKTGKCIEARELIIALPESLQAYDPKLILQYFTESFRQKYGVQCAAALHHNKTKTNYHIHLIFADRDVLEKTEVKKATRNMFYDESGRHVRTKKEILDEQGNVRPGCHILKRGETYDIKWFSAKKEIFKSHDFLHEAKMMYTELINRIVSDNEKLKVFDPSGPYIPTKKIGKNNPKEEMIKSDNELRQEWNRTVDQVLIAGGSQEEVTEFKQSEVTERVSESMRENGNDPSLFAQILRIAIEILKEFLDHLMQDREQESIEKEKEKTEKERKAELKKAKEAERLSDLELAKTEFEVALLATIHEDLYKSNRKLYALQKQQKTQQALLDAIPDNLFHRKERKAAEEQKTEFRDCSVRLKRPEVIWRRYRYYTDSRM